jgi:hypothetical protein
MSSLASLPVATLNAYFKALGTLLRFNEHSTLIVTANLSSPRVLKLQQ